MAQSNSLLRELLSNYPDTVMNDPGFHQMLIDHFAHIRKNTSLITKESVKPLEAAIYKADFHGLLAYKNIDVSLHNILTEFNGLKKSTDFNGQPMEILKISVEFIEKLKKAYQAKKR